MMGFVKTACAAALCISGFGAAHASTFSFGDVDNLGTVTGPQDVEAFYGYTAPDGTMTGTFNADIPGGLELATAYMFIYEDQGDFALGMVFTGANVAQPRVTCGALEDRDKCRTRFQGTVSGLAGASGVLVKDDPGANTFGDTDATGAGANGFYDLEPFTGTTDGFAASGVELGQTVTLGVQTFTNFEQTYWVSGPADNLMLTQIDLGGGTFSILGTPAPVPLPAGFALIVSALMALGAMSRKSRSTA